MRAAQLARLRRIGRSAETIYALPVTDEEMGIELKAAEINNHGQVVGQEFGVAQGVTDPERHIRILVQARVADQRPAGAVGRAEHAAQVGGPGEPLDDPAAWRPGNDT